MRATAMRYGIPGVVATAVLVAAVVFFVDGGNDAAVEAQFPVTPVAAAGVSATGTWQVAASASSTSHLNVGVEEHGVTDLQGAVSSVQARIGAVEAAIRSAGVPADKVTMTGLNVYPGGPYPYPYPVDVPVPAASAVPSMPGDLRGGAYTVAANLIVETANAQQLATAMEAAIYAGATSVNSFYGPTGQEVPPDASILTPAIEQATKQAQTMAQASAKAAGVRLGDIRGVHVAPPFAMFTGPGPSASFWQVHVTVSYDIEP